MCMSTRHEEHCSCRSSKSLASLELGSFILHRLNIHQKDILVSDSNPHGRKCVFCLRTEATQGVLLPTTPASQEQRRVLPHRLVALHELPRPGHDAAGQRGEVVARVQDVGLAALALLQPHEVRAGREERPGALAVELQDDAAHAEHHPHGDQDVVWWRGNKEKSFEFVSAATVSSRLNH